MRLRGAAMFLRTLGPIIEVACIVALFSLPSEERRLLGVPVRHLLYGGFAIGLALVVVGIGLSLTGAGRPAKTVPRLFEEDDAR